MVPVHQASHKNYFSRSNELCKRFLAKFNKTAYHNLQAVCTDARQQFLQKLKRHNEQQYSQAPALCGAKGIPQFLLHVPGCFEIDRFVITSYSDITGDGRNRTRTFSILC
jgi:hypothetical protein